MLVERETQAHVGILIELKLALLMQHDLLLVELRELEFKWNAMRGHGLQELVGCVGGKDLCSTIAVRRLLLLKLELLVVLVIVLVILDGRHLWSAVWRWGWR